jgi:perosamine synthetase
VPIPYGRQFLDDEDVQAVVDVLKGDWLTQGPAVAEFEQAFAEICGVPYAVAFSSGTAALHGAVFAAGLEAGDEFVTSALTFAASANCGLYLGATPRFADIERETWNVSARTLAPLVGERTRLVIPVHFAGLPAPIAEIREALDGHVRIVEDAAHALGARTPAGPVGSCTHSDMAVFSFHPVKAITSAEGGMVTTREPALRDRLVLFRSHGITKNPHLLREQHGGWHQEQQALGFNYRLTDVHSALGRSQLRKLERFIRARNEIASRYRSALTDVEALELPPEAPPGSLHAYHLFIIRHRDGAEARRALYDGLVTREIRPQVHYIPVYQHPYFRDRLGNRLPACPETERYYAGCLSLPCFPTLTPDDQDRVVAALRELCG